MDARAWDERYAASELVWSATPNQFVAAELAGADARAGRSTSPPARAATPCGWPSRGWQVTAVDFSLAGLDKGRALQERHEHGRDLHVDWVHADVLTYEAGPVALRPGACWPTSSCADDERRTAVRRAFGALRVGGTFLLVAHDSTNLTEGTGGPQDPDVLYTAEDVLADLDGERFEVERAERVARTRRAAATTHRGEPDAHGVRLPGPAGADRLTQACEAPGRRRLARLLGCVGLLLEVDLPQLLAHAEPQQDHRHREGEEHAEPEPARLHVGGVGALGRRGDRSRRAGCSCLQSLSQLADAGEQVVLGQLGRRPGCGRARSPRSARPPAAPPAGIANQAPVGVDLGGVRQQRLVADREVLRARHPRGDPGVVRRVGLPLLEPLRVRRLQPAPRPSPRAARRVRCRWKEWW